MSLVIPLETWLAAARATVERGELAPPQIDVDQVLGPGYAQPWDLVVALELFDRALRLAGPLPWLLSLAVPLTPTVGLRIEPPRRETLPGELHESTPPGLYLLGPQQFFSPDPWEHYHVLLDGALPLDVPAGASVRYACFRTPEARAADEEWERTLWVDHWPSTNPAGRSTT